MLNGIDPIIIFNFSKLAPDVQASVADIPIVSSIVKKIGLPPIPVYLSEVITGLCITSEEKIISAQTNTETLANGDNPKTDQKGIESTIKIEMEGDKESIGIILLSAMADRVFDKLSSKEYSITYLHQAVTIFNGLLHSFNISQPADMTKLTITFELARQSQETQQKEDPPDVQRTQGVTLGPQQIGPAIPLPFVA